MKIIFFFISLLFLLHPLLPGNNTKKSVSALKIDDKTTVTVDGKPDEEIWQKSKPFSGFIQYEPAKGTPASMKTEFRVLYNSRYIYFGITCFDSQPQKITAQVN